VQGKKEKYLKLRGWGVNPSRAKPSKSRPKQAELETTRR